MFDVSPTAAETLDHAVEAFSCVSATGEKILDQVAASMASRQGETFAGEEGCCAEATTADIWSGAPC